MLRVVASFVLECPHWAFTRSPVQPALILILFLAAQSLYVDCICLSITFQIHVNFLCAIERCVNNASGAYAKPLY
jgi:hypothetical protein